MNSNKNCETCGCEYEANWYRYSIYCSNACKQKAYRARKKQEAIAKSLTMTFTEKKEYDCVVSVYPEFKQHFQTFHTEHGFEQAVDMMIVMREMIAKLQLDGV